jgi:hypothetical protein
MNDELQKFIIHHSSFLIQSPRHNQFKLRNRNFKCTAILYAHKRIKTVHFPYVTHQIRPRFIPKYLSRRQNRLATHHAVACNLAHRYTRIVNIPMSVHQTHRILRQILNRDSVSKNELTLVRATQIHPIARFHTNFDTVCN